MGHNYYYEDYERGNTHRLQYFDSWFETLASKQARKKGLTLSSYLSQITGINSFKRVLREVFGDDPSLGYYVDGMTQEGFRIFFNRPLIQEIVESNKKDESQKIKLLIPAPPDKVEQVEEEIVPLFKGFYTEKKTGKKRYTFAKKITFIRGGKEVVAYQSKEGKFIKMIKRNQ